MSNIKYFTSFETYEKPPVPIDEVSFPETCSLPTFYTGWFDDEDRLTRLVKYAVTRLEQRDFRLAETREPNSVVYFLVHNTRDDPINWEPVDYDATERESQYYRGVVSDDGRQGTAHRFERVVAFDEDYTDLHTGGSRQRVTTRTPDTQE